MEDTGAQYEPGTGGLLHPRLSNRFPWLEHDGELSVVEGTPIRLEADHLPGGPGPVALRSRAIRVPVACPT